jgi:carbamoyl-phosphate synthase large subunit
VGGGGLGEQIIKALRLASTRYRIVGTDITPYSKGFVDLDEAEIVPPAIDARFKAVLLRLCEKHHIQAVLCGSEAELKAFDRERADFARRGIFLPINPSSVLDICLDKVKTAQFLSANGFSSPTFRRISSLEDVKGFPHLPAVIKPSVGSGGSANLFLAQTPRELEVFAEHLLTTHPEFIVQEYVGTPEAEFTVGVLTAMDGTLLNSIAIRRHLRSAISTRINAPNRTARTDLGATLVISNGISQGEIGAFPEVTGTCEQIAAALGSRGPLNVQCRLVNGTVNVFEINPRFSGTTSLRAMAGYNEPDVLIRRHVLNELIEPHFKYRSCFILRGLSEALVEVDQFERLAWQSVGEPM